MATNVEYEVKNVFLSQILFEMLGNISRGTVHMLRNGSLSDSIHPIPMILT